MKLPQGIIILLAVVYWFPVSSTPFLHSHSGKSHTHPLKKSVKHSHRGVGSMDSKSIQDFYAKKNGDSTSDDVHNIKYRLRPKKECFVFDPDIRGRYNGNCDKGKAHGRGNSKGKDIFNGVFHYGKIKKGIYYFSNGKRFDGKFNEDESYKYGTLTSKDGRYFHGSFKKGKPYSGKYTNKDGTFEIKFGKRIAPSKG